MDKEPPHELNGRKANVLAEPGGHIICFNEVFPHLWKISSPSSVSGKNISQFFNDRDRFHGIVAEILTDGSWSGALGALDESNSRFPVKAQCDLVSNCRGESLYMIWKCWPEDPLQNWAAAPSQDTQKRTIMLVDDDDLVRNVVYTMIEDTGYNVISIDSGQTALRISDGYEGEIDVLITDILMPGMDGKELAHILTGRRPGLRVIYMSGHHGGLLQHSRENNPGNPFLRKPFIAEELLKAVQRVMEGESSA